MAVLAKTVRVSSMLRSRLSSTAAPAAAAAAAATSKPQRTYGGLNDDDRVFQNLYGVHDWRLKEAMKRVSIWILYGRVTEGKAEMPKLFILP